MPVCGNPFLSRSWSDERMPATPIALVVGREIHGVDAEEVLPPCQDRLRHGQARRAGLLRRPVLVREDRAFVIREGDVGSLADAGGDPVVASLDRLDDRESRDAGRRVRVEEWRALVGRRAAVERPVPALAQRDGLIGGDTISAEAPDRGQGPGLRGVVRGPGRVERARTIRRRRTHDRVGQRPGLRVAEQVGPEEPERPLARDREDLRCWLDEARRQECHERLVSAEVRGDLVCRDAGGRRREGRLIDRYTARHHELAAAGERPELVEGDRRLEIRDAGNDGEREADRGNRRGRRSWLGRRGGGWGTARGWGWHSRIRRAASRPRRR